MNIGIMMLLGGAVFSVNTTTYDRITRAARFQWQSIQVIGRRPVYQYLGHGENSITMNGRVYPGQYGSRAQLLILEKSAGLGIPMPLFTGGGLTLGAWCITAYSEIEGEPLQSGSSRRIDFTVELVQYASLFDFLVEQASAYIKSGSDIVKDFVP